MIRIVCLLSVLIAACSSKESEESLLAGNCEGGVVWNEDDKAEGVKLTSGQTATLLAGAKPGQGVRANTGFTSGKYYWSVFVEVARGAGNGIGVATKKVSLGDVFLARTFSPCFLNGGRGWYQCEGYAYNNVSPAEVKTGDVVMVAIDADLREAFFAINGKWANDADPLTGYRPFKLTSPPPYYPMVAVDSGDVYTAYFGAYHSGVGGGGFNPVSTICGNGASEKD